MLRYLLRRIVLAVPTLMVISFMAFGLLKCAPGDPVVNTFGEESYRSLDPAQQAIAYKANAVLLGLERPVFYFSWTTAAYPDTLWRIFPLNRREKLEKLIGETGNWPAVKNCDQAISATARAVEALPSSIPQTAGLRSELTVLVGADRVALLEASAARLHSLSDTMPVSTHSIDTYGLGNPEFGRQKTPSPALTTALSQLDTAIHILQTQHLPGNLRSPAIHWHGFDNQYHWWLMGFLTGELGYTRRKVKVWDELRPSLLSTLAINGLAIFLAYLIAVPLGVEMARQKGRWLDRWAKRTLFFLSSMPVFWLGGLLIMIVTNSALLRAAIPSVYFDIQDAWHPGKTSFAEWWSSNASKCILPIIILSVHALALLALQMRGGMLSTLGADFIRTARAKGVSEEDVYWNHALRNALFPIITIFASVLPAVFTGSIVLEALFSFPGIGTKTFEAYLGKDLPLLASIMMVAATLTIIGSLLADVLYAWADPRVRFSKENG